MNSNFVELKSCAIYAKRYYSQEILEGVHFRMQ